MRAGLEQNLQAQPEIKVDAAYGKNTPPPQSLDDFARIAAFARELMFHSPHPGVQIMAGKLSAAVRVEMAAAARIEQMRGRT